MNNYILHNDQTNIYDIIIEKVRKEYDVSMSDTQSEKWEIPRYSRKQINRAGKTLISPEASNEDTQQALDVLNNWRAAHAYPLQVITSNLRQRNKDAVVVQRLKRLESIKGKIEREPEMELYRMHDLGGCRVIVDSISDVYDAVSNYKESRIRHIFKREYDYIQSPKRSGYRSYHMVYQFHSDKKDTYNKNMLIEIQFRTKLQHIWATAVEMMGIYTRHNLKSSQGDKYILRFFTLVSSVFAIRENTPVCPETSDWLDELITEIKEIDQKVNIMSKLLSLNGATKIINDMSERKLKSKNTYFLLILDYYNHQTKVRSFTESQLELATKIYSKIEQNPEFTGDVVLVSASSLDTLIKAYPNYFVDISEFVNIINQIYANLQAFINQADEV